MAVDTLSLHLFQGYGVEIEYMIVGRQDLNVRPITDRLLQRASGSPNEDVLRDGIGWSNELAAHVVELKTAAPVSHLRGVSAGFIESIREMNRLLAEQGACLMPGGAHPWMDPTRETELWAHDYSEVYREFDRIFNCRRHGWANLQSVHLNLPFANDEELARLHAAIRLLLPILPALAASTPILEGRVTGLLDTRLDVYRENSRKIPAIAGRVIPEPVFSQRDYEREILQPIYEAIAPFDTDGVLQHEWLNARGAIARFDRNAIEIRVIDAQECPQADLAICAAAAAVLQALVAERWANLSDQLSWEIDALEPIFLRMIRDAELTTIDDERFLQMFGFPGKACSASELWSYLIDACQSSIAPEHRKTLETILQDGTLARRILKTTGTNPTPTDLQKVYGDLCGCLADGRMFLP